MTDKEKAKAYDEALERAKKWRNAPNVDKMPTYGNRVIEEIFPELKESEDEKIRNALIDLVKCNERSGYMVLNNVSTGSMIAWLEKQGNPQVRTGLEWVNTIDNACDERYTKEYSHGEYCHEQSFKWGFQEGVEWLEKQGEQKVSRTTIMETGNGGINALVTKELYVDKTEQKPTDKVEPKFKVGDWIVNDYCMGKVVALTDDAYLLDTGQGIPFSCEHNAHLWTIQDAKDGDVLACENGWTCIFNCLYDNLFNSHCFMDAEGWFCEDGGQAHTLDNRICGEIHPATKEQRDRLERAMTNAGYRWNKEELKLERI